MFYDFHTMLNSPLFDPYQVEHVSESDKAYQRQTELSELQQASRVSKLHRYVDDTAAHVLFVQQGVRCS